MTSPTPHALSFILGGRRREIDFLATASEASDLFQHLRSVQMASRTANQDSVQDLQVRPLSAPSPGSASELLTTITDAVDTDDTEEDPEIQTLTALAEASDTLAETDSTPLIHEVNFAWDNGGGDDNLFTQDFLGSSSMAGVQASTAFADALEQWLNNHSHAYDFTLGPGEMDAPTDTLVEAVGDLAQELDDAVASGDAPLVASVWAGHLRQAVEEPATPPAPARRKPGVR